MLFPSKLFVTGTDTNVGKTFVSAILATGLRAAYWKPVQSGIDGGTDRAAVRHLSGLPEDHFFPEAYCFTQPLSPHAAALIDGKHIEFESLLIPEAATKFQHLIIEGAGGILVPLNATFVMIDLIKKFGAPVIIVARSGLGTINHTCLTVDKLRSEGVEILGVVMNGPRNQSNKEAIEHFANVPVIAEIETIANPLPETMIKLFQMHFGNVKVPAAAVMQKGNTNK